MNPVSICDRLPLAGVQRDSAGNLIGVARAARTGIQVYAGYEVGRPDLASVKVYRPEGEVFSADSMRTYAGQPVTIEHPNALVTPENWRDHAVGETESDNIVRDGDVVKVPFIVRDAKGIAAIEDGKHEVSMGYTAMLDFAAGVVPDGQRDAGQAYDAVQRSIRINHLAIVDKARAGPEFRIGDNQPQEPTVMTTMIVDGLQVVLTDAASTKAAIDKLMGERTALTQSVADAQGQLGTLTAEVETLKGEKAVLEASLADATSPDKLTAAANARAKLVEDAKRVVPTVVTDNLPDAAIKRAVVEAKIGDAGKALADGPAIDGAFASLVATAPAKPGPDPLAQRVTGQSHNDDGDVASLMDARNAARDARRHRLANFGADAKTA